MIRLKDVVIDCQHPASLARFWAGLIDDYDVAPYDDEELARLADLGVTDLEDDPGVMVVGSTAPRLYFQRVPEPRSRRTGCTSIYKPTSPIRRWLESSISAARCFSDMRRSRWSWIPSTTSSA